MHAPKRDASSSPTFLSSFASCPLTSPSDITRTSNTESLSPRWCACIKVWLLRESCHSRTMPRLIPLVVPAGVVDCDPVVPQRRSPRRPSEAHLDVDILLIHVVQVSKNHVALSLVQSNNAYSHGSIDPKSFPPSRRMYSNKRMHTLNVLRSGGWIIPIKVCMCAAVHSLLAVDDLSEVRRQLLIRRVACPCQPSIL